MTGETAGHPNSDKFANRLQIVFGFLEEAGLGVPYRLVEGWLSQSHHFDPFS
jgi:hypothetical protein